VVLAASLIPARRAATDDPMVTPRDEQSSRLSAFDVGPNGPLRIS